MYKYLSVHIDSITVHVFVTKQKNMKIVTGVQLWVYLSPNLILWSIASRTSNLRTSSCLGNGGDKLLCPSIPGGDGTGERARNAKNNKVTG